MSIRSDSPMAGARYPISSTQLCRSSLFYHR